MPPKIIKSLIINGPIGGVVMNVCRVDRADLNGPIEFLKLVFSIISRKLRVPGISSLKIGSGPFSFKISSKLIAILLGPKAFLIL